MASPTIAVCAGQTNNPPRVVFERRLMSPFPLNRLKSADAGLTVSANSTPDAPDPEDGVEPRDIPPPVSDAEAAAMRAEKLKAIRRAIAAGAYDSDELLQKALRKMQDSFEKDEP